jgi:hypothetical protein
MSFQGTRFRLGRGQTFIGIWPEGGATEHPLEQWPATPEGWSAAWSRFNELETPGTITQVSQAGATVLPAFRVSNSSALLVIGVVFGAVGLFPAYWSGSSLLSQASELVPHLMYLIAWAVAAVGVLIGGNKARMGALLGLGTSAVTLGMFVGDLGQATGGVSVGAGLIMACIGWAACTAGAVLALRSTWLRSPQLGRELLAKPNASTLGVTVMLTLASIGLAVTFALAWVSYHLTAAASGQTESVTQGFAFSGPGLMIFGNVLVMIAIVAVAVLAGLWRSLRLGAVLLLGAIVPIAAQAISALIQNGQATPSTQFGISAAEAKAIGLTIANGLTPWFWLYCVFGAALLISCAWMLITPPRPAEPAPAAPLVDDTILTGEPVFAAGPPFAATASDDRPATSGFDAAPSDTVAFGDSDEPSADSAGPEPTEEP